MKENGLEELDGLDFVECDFCASKSGTPTLCLSCIKNRNTITELKNKG